MGTSRTWPDGVDNAFAMSHLDSCWGRWKPTAGSVGLCTVVESLVRCSSSWEQCALASQLLVHKDSFHPSYNGGSWHIGLVVTGSPRPALKPESSALLLPSTCVGHCPEQSGDPMSASGCAVVLVAQWSVLVDVQSPVALACGFSCMAFWCVCAAPRTGFPRVPESLYSMP